MQWTKGICNGEYLESAGRSIGVGVFFSNGWYIDYFGYCYLSHTQSLNDAKHEAEQRLKTEILNLGENND